MYFTEVCAKENQMSEICCKFAGQIENMPECDKFAQMCFAGVCNRVIYFECATLFCSNLSALPFKMMMITMARNSS